MNALILLTRVPIPGKTKTRLMDTLSGTECAELHMAFLEDLLTTLQHLQKECDLFLTYTPEDSFFIIEDLILNDMKFFPQQGRDLGDKMHEAIRTVFSKGYEKVVLIGADTPDLRLGDIQEAFALLDKKDVVLGPTFDGGYYLVGMKNSVHSIFQLNEQWGGKSVLNSTIDLCNQLNLSVGLTVKYRDIDTKEDLFAFLKQYEGDPERPAYHTMTYLREWPRKDHSRTIPPRN
jgi:rSAM/selenodomain-associated transferase 1